MRVSLLVLVLLVSSLPAQGHKIAWLVNPEISNDSDAEYLTQLIEEINLNKEIEQVVISGNITVNGKTSELNRGHEILSKLEKTIHIFPGSNETKYSVDGGMIFRELWFDDRFSFAIDSTLYIGFGTSVYYNSNQSHIPVETLTWLTEEITEAGAGRNIVIFTNNPIGDKTDNYAKLVNLLKDYNVSLCLFTNGTSGKDSKESGIVHYCGIPINYSAKKKGGYSLITNLGENISVETIIPDKKPKVEVSVKRETVPEIKEVKESEFENIATLVLWKKDLAYSVLANAITYNKRIFIVDRSGLVTALDNTGKTLWEYDVFGDVVSKPVAADGMLAVATTQGDLNTIEIKSGESIQTIGFDAALTAPLTVIEFTGNKLRMIPKSSKSNTAIIAATDKGKIYCLDFETLEELWVNSDAKDAITTEPVYVDNKIIYTAHDNYLYCIDAREGWLLWKWKPNDKGDYSISNSNLVVDNKNVFLTATNDNVYAVDIKLGKKNWSSKNRKAWEAIAISKDKQKIYVKGSKDNVYVLNSSNGKLIKSVGMKYGYDHLNSSPYPDDKVVFVPAENGLLYRINDEYNYKTIIKMLPAPLHSIVEVTDSEYIICDYDGKIAYFKF